jgi:NADPH:quinone reductase-like Zn-dependent oxidoreductase
MQHVPTSTPAVWIFEYGGPEVLQYGDHPLPELGPADVLVEVVAASVSRYDAKYRAGELGGSPQSRLPGRGALPLPQQLGREAAGVVIAVGADVTRFRPGDRVVAVVHPENPDSPEALRGLGNLSSGIDIPGHVATGAYARYLVRDQRMWLPVSDNVDLELAAITLWSYGTSHRIVIDRLGIVMGDCVLVHGASGGMGQASMQLARLAGARVIATTRYATKVDALRQLGADEVVVVDEMTRAEHIRNLAHADGVDHAIDFTGNRALIRLAIESLRPGGRICLGAGGRTELPLNGFDLTRLELTMLGIRGARHQDALTVLELLHRKVITPKISARFPLSAAAAAHRYLESGDELMGRVILQPS